MAIRSCRPLPPTLCLLMLALSGCGTALHEEDESPVPSTQGAEIRIANSLSTDALVLNAISANPTANGLLATKPLTTLFGPTASSGDAHIRLQLHDPDAQKFMEYLVSCALAAGTALDWYDPRPGIGGPRKWHGKAGLCPDWLNNAPTGECKRTVSACILARNNALGRRVELSLRGQHWTGPGVFTLEAVTRPAEQDPDPSVTLASFTPCTGTQTGAARDCGWKADAIGSCTPGSVVWVGAGGATACPGPALGSSTGGQMVLRVCDGIVGCDRLSARYLTSATGSCSGSAPAVSFICPYQGSPTRSWFSVMTAPWSSLDTTSTATVAVSSNDGAGYNHSEQEVYGTREGAFYGNIFDPVWLHPQVNVYVAREGDIFVVKGDDVHIQGSIYRRMYSCYDPAWSAGAAYSVNRVCALPNSGENCAATVTGPCWNANSPALGMCATQDGPEVLGDGDFELCRDNLGTFWKEPVTTYLNSACDTVKASTGTRTCVRK